MNCSWLAGWSVRYLMHDLGELSAQHLAPLVVQDHHQQDALQVHQRHLQHIQDHIAAKCERRSRLAKVTACQVRWWF